MFIPLVQGKFTKMEVPMSDDKKVKDLMIPLEDYPHIPYWFTLRQAMAIVREAAIKFEGSFEPRAVLVFDEKYQLMGMLTLRDIIKGLEPRFMTKPRWSRPTPTWRYSWAISSAPACGRPRKNR